MKRTITLFTHFYSDAIYVANTLYKPAIDVSLKICDEKEWLYNDGCIIIECYDCIYYIYHVFTLK